MSTRWYPRYVRGNPQLRVFLPDFWMKLKKPDIPLPPNKVLFHVPVQMTNHDIKNYLEKIYKIPVMYVKSRVVCGEIKKAKALPYLIKDDDYREAIIDLPKHVKFEYPDLYGVEREKIEDEIERIQKQFDFVRKREQRRFMLKIDITFMTGLDYEMIDFVLFKQFFCNNNVINREKFFSLSLKILGNQQPYRHLSQLPRSFQSILHRIFSPPIR